jgi:hypothetical protein
MRLALHVGGRPAGRERCRHNNTEPCAVPPEDSRRLQEQGGRTPGRREARGQPHREALPRCPPNTSHELPLGHDELLAEQAVLGDERGSSTEQIGGETGKEPSEISHGGSRTSIGERVEFVAGTG